MVQNFIQNCDKRTISSRHDQITKLHYKTFMLCQIFVDLINAAPKTINFFTWFSVLSKKVISICLGFNDLNV